MGYKRQRVGTVSLECKKQSFFAAQNTIFPLISEP